MSTVAKKAKRLVSWPNVIFLLLCCIVFYFAVHNFTELKSIKKLFSEVDPWWIAVAILSQIFTYVSTAILYYTLMNKYKDPTSVSITDLFKLSIVIVFINQIVPSGGIGGNGFLFNELSKRGISSKKAFFTIIIECLSLYIALAFLMIILPLLYIVNHHTMPELFYIVIAFGFVLYGILAGVMTVLGNRNILHKIIKKLSRIKFLRHYLESVQESPEGTFQHFGTKGPWGIYRKYPKQSLVVIAGQLGVFFADSITIFALLHGLAVHVPYIVIALGLLLTFIVAALPISPGALLVYEGAMTYFYTTMGMPFQTALVITLLFRVLSFWAPIFLGLILYKNVQSDKP
jgi:uncharacterized protein (TIRG00374 family)